MTGLPEDLRLVWRGLRRTPAFAAVAVLTLALSVGANMVAFGVLDALVLRGLPVPDARQLSFVQHGQAQDVALTFPQYRDLRERNRTFTEMGAYDLEPVGLMLHGKTEQRWATFATGSYFDLLGVRAFLGRFPSAADDSRGLNAAPYAVLTYDTWRDEFGGDQGIIGRKVVLSKHPFTIVAVAPPGFYGTERFFRPVLWVDLPGAASLVGEAMFANRGSQWSMVIGRRKPGVTPAAATADLNRIAAALQREYPKTDGKLTFALAEPGYVGNYFGPALHGFLGGVMLLAGLGLAAACVNLSGMYAARAAERRREIAVRFALGSTRARVVAGLIGESLLLSLAGGALGCLLAKAALHLLTNYRPPFGFPIAVAVEPAPEVYGFALVLCAGAGMVCALAPVWEAGRPSLQEILRSGASRLSGGRRQRLTLRDALLLLEMVLCCLLVTAGAVSLRGLYAARHASLGFDPGDVFVARYNLDIAGYSGERALQFDRALLAEAGRIPGVSSAAISSNTPLTLGGNNAWFYRQGTTDLGAANRIFTAKVFAVTPDYFRTAGTALLAGRDFTWSDDAHAPEVAVVNQQFAHLLFGDRPAVGESYVDAGGHTVRIVGLAEQGKVSSLNEPPSPAVFVPLLQGPDMFSFLLVRVAPGAAAADAGRFVNALTTSIRHQDPTVAIDEVRPWSSALAPALFPARAAAVALGLLGGLSIVLAVTGIFGLASYTVARRLRDLSVRVALGAGRRAVLKAAFGEIARVVAGGAAGGVLLGLASTRVLAAIVYGARAGDPWVLAVVALTVSCVGLGAMLGPALRALRADPVLLLRGE